MALRRIRNDYRHGERSSERDLREIKHALQQLQRRTKEMFESLEAKVQKITSATDAMQVVLADVRQKLKDIIAGGGMDEAAKQKLADLEAALDKEADDVIASTLEGTGGEPNP